MKHAACIALVFLSLAAVAAAPPSPQQAIPVRYPEGLVHGFLTLKTLQGKLLADGDLIQNVRGDRVTSRLVFHFKDGSLHDETVVYSQRQHFRVISDHLRQRGPAFPRDLDMTLDAASGRVTLKYTEDDEQKVETDQIEVPPNLVNGLVSTILKNVRSNALPEPFAYLALTPKPRLVKLEVTAAGLESFSTGGTGRKAMHYILKVKIGGIAGFIAPLVGKDPPDVHVWILGGEAPAFIRAEQPLFTGGPIWRIELTSPNWK